MQKQRRRWIPTRPSQGTPHTTPHSTNTTLYHSTPHYTTPSNITPPHSTPHYTRTTTQHTATHNTNTTYQICRHTEFDAKMLLRWKRGSIQSRGIYLLVPCTNSSRTDSRTMAYARVRFLIVQQHNFIPFLSTSGQLAGVVFLCRDMCAM